MKRYQIEYEDGRKIIVEAKNALDLVKKYDLACRANINAKIKEVTK